MSEPVARPADPVDLTNCDREPIHIPGAIQPHGALLVLSEPDLRILQISGNCGELLGVGVEAALAGDLGLVLDAASVDAVRSALTTADPRARSPLRVASLPRARTRFDAIMHRSAELAILELEPAPDIGQTLFGDFYRQVRTAMTSLQRAGRVGEMCHLAAEAVAALTGFDRAMVYRFDRDDHGHVVAEVTARDGLDSYLDLHYPASDIPVQARRLYTLNWLRLIVDATYQPVDVLPADNPRSGAPLDLSFATLRSVSPIHLQYLRNMGVQASMSVSLVVDGRLWGMIICHHYSPRFVPYDVRGACELLGQALSWQVAARERADAAEQRATAQHALGKLIDQLAGGPDLAASLIADPGALLGLVDASGAAARLNGTWTGVGETPGPADLELIAEPLREHLVDGVAATDSLAGIAPQARRFDVLASGALAVALAPEHGDLVIWFRPEVVQTVNWAGDPNKLATLADGADRLSPRGSFATWREEVRSRSLPWQPWEVEVAGDLRRAIVGRVLQRNAELVSLNDKLARTTDALASARNHLEKRVEERTAELSAARDDLEQYAEHLTRSNVELERFAYVASHDLQEPLRMVVSYVQLLSRRYKGKLDSDADEFIGYAVDGAKRMQTLISDLLAYSRVGRQERPMGPVQLEEILRISLDNLKVSIADAGAEVTHDPLPTVVGDGSQLGQLLQNLIGNALKFTGDRQPAIHIGADRRGEEWVISVRDNGIGIAKEHIGRIFAIFQRLHTRAEYPGSGIGLAIGKKIVERHGGRIWVESKPGEGATFCFSLPDRKGEGAS